jgi:HK97 family phage portal protein
MAKQTRGFFSRLLRGEKKESAVGSAIAAFNVRQAVNTPREYEKLAKEAYLVNVIAYRCIDLVATAASGVWWKLYNNGKQVDNHPLIDLINKPNPMTGGTQFIDQLVTYILLSGNAYIEKTTFNSNEPRELWNLRPDRMRVVAGSNGLPYSYEHEVNGVKTVFPVDPITGRSNVCHLKKTHPLNDWYGMGAVEPAAYSIDQHNAASLHNTALLQNSASPSGAMVFKGNITPEQIEAVEEKMRQKYATPRNAGKPMTFGGEWEWLQLGLNMKDLDYNEGKLAVARDICTAFGVPHELIISGQSTYNNKAEAKLMLWEDTVIPLLCMLKDGFFDWLTRDLRGYSFEFDLNDVSALIPRRQMHSMKVMQEWTSGLITRDEARLQIGYDKAKERGGDTSDQNFPLGVASKSAAPEIKSLDDLYYAGNEIDQPELLLAVSRMIEAELYDIVRIYGKDVVEEIGRRAAFDITYDVEYYIKASTSELVSQINRTTKKLLKQEISDAIAQRESFDSIKLRVMDVFGGNISEYRAAMIAATEATAATGFAADTAMLQAGIEMKEWLATPDAKTRDTHASMDGQKQRVDDYFISPSGDRGKFPGGFGSAGENINCRCAVAAVFDDEARSASTEQSRALLWEKREAKRITAEKRLMTTAKKIFTMQGAEVLKRMNSLHQEPGSF